MREPGGLALLLGCIALGFVAVLVSYGMAHAGHQSAGASPGREVAAWFWRDILGAFL